MRLCLNCLEQRSGKQRFLNPVTSIMQTEESSALSAQAPQTPLGSHFCLRSATGLGSLGSDQPGELASAAAISCQAHFLSHSLCPPIPMILPQYPYFYFYCNCDCTVLLYHSIKFNHFLNSYMCYPTAFLDISFG